MNWSSIGAGEPLRAMTKYSSHNFLKTATAALLAFVLWSGVAGAQQPSLTAPKAPALVAPADEQLQKAEAALQKEDYETAAPLLEQYLSHRPTDVSARFNLALAYSMTRRGAQAIEQYTRVLAEQPDLIPAHLNLGMMLRFEEKYDEALKHLEFVVEKQPDRKSTRLNSSHVSESRMPSSA